MQVQKVRSEPLLTLVWADDMNEIHFRNPAHWIPISSILWSSHLAVLRCCVPQVFFAVVYHDVQHLHETVGSVHVVFGSAIGAHCSAKMYGLGGFILCLLYCFFRLLLCVCWCCFCFDVV